MIAEIATYLQQPDPDFNTGFGLFCKYSVNTSLMSWIGRKRDSEMLRYELQKLSDFPPRLLNPAAAAHEAQYNPAPAPAERPAREAPAAEARHEIVFRTYDERRTRRGDLPAELQSVYDRTVQEYPVRRGYHEKMKAARTDADRAAFRARLLDTESRIRAGWNEIDAFLQEEESRKMQEAPFDEGNCRAYISKALKKDNPSDRVKAGVKARLKALSDHGCIVTPETLDTLRSKGLA